MTIAHPPCSCACQPAIAECHPENVDGKGWCSCGPSGDLRPCCEPKVNSSSLFLSARTANWVAHGDSAFRNPVPLEGPADASAPTVFSFQGLVLVNQPACPESEGQCNITFHITLDNTTDPAARSTVSPRTDTYSSAGGIPTQHDVWNLTFDYVPSG